jgi:hypothetical protein
MIIQPPESGEETELVWRYVRECITVINALQNMIVQSQDFTGKLEVGSDHSILHIKKREDR